jgi:hypothetical protein
MFVLRRMHIPASEPEDLSEGLTDDERVAPENVIDRQQVYEKAMYVKFYLHHLITLI